MDEKEVRHNVLVLSYLFPNRAQSDYGVFVLNRLKAVAELCNVRVIAPVQWYPLIDRVRSSLRGTRIPIREVIGGLDVYHPRFPVIPRFLKWIDAISYLWAAVEITRTLLRREVFAFDIVDVHWTYPDVVAGYFLARNRGTKWVVTVRGHEALYQEERSIRRWLVAQFLRRADFVVTLSAELQDKVIALGVQPAKTQVVLNGVDLAHFHRMDRDMCREQLGLTREKRIIVSVGRVTEGKGHQELVRMMRAVGTAEEVELFIIGGVNPEGDFTRTLTDLIAELGLNNVHIVDKVDHKQLPKWYCAADLFCLATKREGCPNVVLEALACGTPVVVTDVGAVREIVADGKNGYVIDLAHLSSLADVVRKALDKAWSRNGIAEDMVNWGWAACAQQVVGVYRKAILEGKPNE